MATSNAINENCQFLFPVTCWAVKGLEKHFEGHQDNVLTQVASRAIVPLIALWVDFKLLYYRIAGFAFALLAGQASHLAQLVKPAFGAEGTNHLELVSSGAKKAEEWLLWGVEGSWIRTLPSLSPAVPNSGASGTT